MSEILSNVGSGSVRFSMAVLLLVVLLHMQIYRQKKPSDHLAARRQFEQRDQAGNALLAEEFPRPLLRPPPSRCDVVDQAPSLGGDADRVAAAIVSFD